METIHHACTHTHTHFLRCIKFIYIYTQTRVDSWSQLRYKYNTHFWSSLRYKYKQHTHFWSPYRYKNISTHTHSTASQSLRPQAQTCHQEEEGKLQLKFHTLFRSCHSLEMMSAHLTLWHDLVLSDQVCVA